MLKDRINYVVREAANVVHGMYERIKLGDRVIWKDKTGEHSGNIVKIYDSQFSSGSVTYEVLTSDNHIDIIDKYWITDCFMAIDGKNHVDYLIDAIKEKDREIEELKKKLNKEAATL